ncbi:hypothetical protein [Streptacidiphilus sp. PAMC 29251]
MSGGIMRREAGPGGLLIPRAVGRDMERVAGATRLQQTVIRAKSAVGEHALSEVSYLKAIQRTAEQGNPDAADAIALIVNITVQGIARSCAQFNAEID